MSQQIKGFSSSVCLFLPMSQIQKIIKNNDKIDLMMAVCVYANFNNHNIELIHSFNEKSWMCHSIHSPVPSVGTKGYKICKLSGLHDAYVLMVEEDK